MSSSARPVGGRRALLAPALAAVLILTGGLAAVADEATPSRGEVEDAQQRATSKARDVATIQAELAVANARLDQSATTAAQAAEAYNGARWRLEQAQQKARRTERAATQALDSVAEQQAAYGDAVASTYQQAPELSALDGVLQADGIEEALQTTATLDQAQTAMGEQYDEFRASATLATVASDQATDARRQAVEAEASAGAARSAAEAAQTSAQSEALRIAEQKTRLITEMADLQNVSVALAQRRQSALEEQAAAEAARSRAAEVDSPTDAVSSPSVPVEEPEAPPVQVAAAPAPDDVPAVPAAPAAPAVPAVPAGPSVPQPPVPDTPSVPDPPAPPAPPAPSGGTSAAIAFARAQIGEPYVWGAAGPNAWDCSGLTQGAWAVAGKYLPHYSVAQYQQSTPISPSDLRPGDLLFWGSSSNSGSIYHVALYIGDGQMIHAPRSGRPVTQESMYYWIAPNFYARP